MEKLIYHFVPRSDWQAQAADPYFVTSSLARQGFIHCSTKEQVVDVANRLYRGRNDLMLLEITESKVSAPIKYENLEGGEKLFPHIYGKLNKEAIVTTAEFPCLADGGFVFPFLDR